MSLMRIAHTALLSDSRCCQIVTSPRYVNDNGLSVQRKTNDNAALSHPSHLATYKARHQCARYVRSAAPQYLLSINDLHDLVLEVFVEDVAGHLTSSLNDL